MTDSTQKRTKEDCQFTPGNNPARLDNAGNPLPAVDKPLANAKEFSPIGVRFYDGDHQRLMSMGRERSGIIRDAVHEYLKTID